MIIMQWSAKVSIFIIAACVKYSLLGIKLVKKSIELLKKTVHDNTVDFAEAYDIEAKLFASKGKIFSG